MNYEKEINKIDPDVQHHIFNKGFNAGQEHSQPSQKTLELIKNLENKNSDLFILVRGIDETLHSEFGIVTLLKEIKTQALKTNGRMNAMENWKAGIVAVVSLLSIAVPSTLWYFINKFDTINTQVLTHIARDTEAFDKLK